MFENIIGSKSKIAILQSFFASDNYESTIRKLSIVSQTPYSVTYRDIEQLVDEHFVILKKQGSHKIVSINTEHELYSKISELFSMDSDTVNSKPKKMFQHKNGLIIIHHNADPDAVGSAIALARGLNQSNLKCDIFAPGGLSSQSKKLLEKYPYPILDKINKYPKLVFILDTSSPEQLNGIKVPETSKLVIIDHHRAGKLAESADLKIIDPSVHATAILVYDLLISAGINITSEIAFFLMTAIVADTGHFRLINQRDMDIVHKLISNVNMDDVFAALSTRLSHEEKIVRLKSLKQMEIYTIKDKIVVFSVAGSFESKVAKHIIESFADIAIVENISGKSVRISGRARKYLKDKIDLSLVFKGIGKDIAGNGGGHDIVASANGSSPDNIELVRDKIKTYIETAFNGTLKRFEN